MFGASLSRRLLLAAIVAPATARADPCCGPITNAGARLVAFLDGTGVDRLWLPRFRVNWETGAAISEWPDDGQSHTHCSAFVASAAKRLGIHILRPPEHSAALLANAQMGWLRGPDAAAEGWQPVPDAIAAQTSANQGNLVLAAFQNPDPDRPGHIAIVRPSDIDADTLLANGPFVTQAGGHNGFSIPLIHGFANHKGAWLPGGGGAVRFFAHPVYWSAPAPP
jgi:hypothetical protein